MRDAREGFGGPQRTPAYAWYVLAVLAIVYLFNFLDRQILSILAQAIKRDLGVSDARLGFLYGTAFAIFYAIFGIPLARLADVWVRKNVIALGLACWSLMTALSGTAQSFSALAAFRIGVGIGESSATPAAYSMLSDSFPAEKRATAFALYAAGVYLGQGVGYYLGGWILDAWALLFPSGSGWLDLQGWQAAFLAVGLPGLLLAGVVWKLREPERGQYDASNVASRVESPLRTLAAEVAAVLPPFTFWSLSRAGASRRMLLGNGFAAIGSALGAWALVEALGPPEQWIALGVGIYCTLSWAQGMALRDPPAFALLVRGRAAPALMGGAALMSFVNYAFMFWSAPFLLRAHGKSAAEVGFWLMIASAGGGGIGVALGGVLSDLLKRRSPAGRIHVVLGSLSLVAPCALGFLFARTPEAAYALAVAFNVATTAWVGSATAALTELVLPRMRAVATAVMLTMYTFVGLALGPYTVGRVSDALAARVGDAVALRTGLAMGLLALVPALLLLLRALRHVASDEASVRERAQRAGEAAHVPAPVLRARPETA
jgi:MFS family permease